MDAVPETQPQPGMEDISETNAEVPQESVVSQPSPAPAEEQLEVGDQDEVTESAEMEPEGCLPDTPEKSPEPPHEDAEPLPTLPQAAESLDANPAPAADPENGQPEQRSEPETLPMAGDAPEPEKVHAEALPVHAEAVPGEEEARAAPSSKEEDSAPALATQEVAAPSAEGKAAELAKDAGSEEAAAIAVKDEELVVADTAKVAQSTPEGAAEQHVEALPREVVQGSFTFALLDREETRVSLAASRTLVVLRGLPGSGKTLLSRALADGYPGLCTVVRGDDHGVKPEAPEASVDAYKALDAAVATCCCSAAAGTGVMVVVDDTNHTQDRLARLVELAEEQRLVAVFLEPRTPWRRDAALLAERGGRGLVAARLEAMRAVLEETDLPLFFGWFLLSPVQEKVACTAMDFLKMLDTLEVFKKHMSDFTGETDKEVDLEQYFESRGALHCTTKFCDYGKAAGAKEYVEEPAVQDLYGSVSELSLTALFVTPRTFGARVSLTSEQLVLWAADDNEEEEKKKKEGEKEPAAMPVGSRAHVTLGCAEGVEAVQTGLDLLEILGLGGATVDAEMELGSLAYYGEGRWLLSLREPIAAPALFSSYYAAKAEQTKKESSEKKKKPKCVIL